ncbi:MAG: S8 family peptidase [Bacteroidia bacterium]|nr:S8 family peptidase [Bacteroidia bacterium]
MRYLIVFLLSNFVILSQSTFNTDLIVHLRQYKGYPLHLIVLTKNPPYFIQQIESQPQKAKILYASGNLVRCVFNDTSFLMNMIREKVILRAEMYRPKKLSLLNDTMIVRNRILPVKTGVPPLPQGYDGSGVLLGLIDSGIDFSHPDFKDNNGKTRILYLWDQAVTGTIIPMPYGYGQEWDSAAINSGSCTHNDLAFWGHGTHVAGIASGNGQSTGNHQGCAPQSNLIAVALDFNASIPVIADAVQYIVNKSNQLNLPVAINASVGDYYGSHDATDLQSQMIISLISNQPGKIMCGAAGNAGNIKFHVQCNPNNFSDTLFTWIQNSSGSLEHWIYADTNQIKNVLISVGCTNPAFQYLGNIGFKNFNYALNTIQYDTLKVNNNVIGKMMFSSSINSFGVYELYIKISADSLNYLWSIESKGIGSFDAWNFDFVSSGLPTVSQFPKIQYYVMPDTVSSIVSGFQCSSEIITVANYVNLKQYYDYNNNLQTTSETAGALAYHSSCGPTRNGIIKPDIAATGNSVFSCIAMGMQNFLITNYPNMLALGGYHVLGGGTSAASPVVTGLGLLFLQAFPYATNQIFKNAITMCTYKDSFTGYSLPDNKWGYGKLDGLSTFTCSGILSSTKQSKDADRLFFPNPANNFIVFNTNVSKIKITDMFGRVVVNAIRPSQQEKWQINVSNLSDGIYLIETEESLDKKYFDKIIISH